jgi:hypothetical protein
MTQYHQPVAPARQERHAGPPAPSQKKRRRPRPQEDGMTATTTYALAEVA